MAFIQSLSKMYIIGRLLCHEIVFKGLLQYSILSLIKYITVNFHLHAGRFCSVFFPVVRAHSFSYDSISIKANKIQPFFHSAGL